MPPSLDNLPGKEVFSDTLVSSSIWKLLCIILIFVNFKNLPFVWHVSARFVNFFLRRLCLTYRLQVRLLNAFRFVLRLERSRGAIRPAQLFQPLITESHGSLMELDYNIHSECLVYSRVLDPRSDHSICRIKQHLLSGRRYCPNASHLHIVLGWNRAGEKKQRTRDLRCGVRRCQLFV